MTQVKLSMKQNRFMDIENSLVVTKGEEVGGRTEWEVGVSRYKLLYTEWMKKTRSYYIAQGTIFNILW